jgi:tripartite motif-containing protein 71
VQVYTLRGEHVRTWGRRGRAQGEFDTPQHVAVAGAHVFVCDSGNGRVQVFSLEGVFEQELLLNAHSEPLRQLGRPAGIVVMLGPGHTRVFVSDAQNHCIHVFAADGSLNCTWGMHGADVGRLDAPAGLAVAEGLVFACDSNNHRVQIFTPDGTFVRAWEHLKRNQGGLFKPLDIAVCEGGFAYVCDQNETHIHQFALV